VADRPQRLPGERRHHRERRPIADHESAKATTLYDRAGDQITLDKAERIVI
jgi:hypothetical protein